MAGMGIDGLVSGLQTTDLINQLMKAEAIPQGLLKNKQTDTNAFITALQALNTKVSSLADAAAAAAKAVSWNAYAATSSSGSVSASTTTDAQASELSFTVDKLATAQTSVTGNVATLEGLLGTPLPTSVTIATGSGSTAKATVVDLTGVTDLAEFASKLNSSGAGVTASVVKISATESRLQLTGKATGEVAAFDLHVGTVAEADIQAGTAPAALIARGGATTAAGDAQITLWGNQQITSATNSFTDVLEGVTITVTKKEPDPVALTIKRDDAALKKMASGLVGALGVVFSEIASRTKTTTTTTDDGRSVVSGGIFSADSAIRNLQQQLQTAVLYPVDGFSPAEVGISMDKDGVFSLDEAKFAEAMAADPAKVQSIVSGLAARVEDVAKSTSNSIDGSLTTKIKNQEGDVKTLGDKISDWDRRLALKRTGLQATYSALEVSLSKMQSTSSWLTGQLASLPSWS